VLDCEVWVKTLCKGSRRAWVEEKIAASDSDETMPNGVTGVSVLVGDGRISVLNTVETVCDGSTGAPVGDGIANSVETVSKGTVGVLLAVVVRRLAVMDCEIPLITVANGSGRLWVDNGIPTSGSSETALKGETGVPLTVFDGTVNVLDFV
jgi:hypothetical protein